jgi:hypothetical protein
VWISQSDSSIPMSHGKVIVLSLVAMSSFVFAHSSRADIATQTIGVELGTDDAEQATSGSMTTTSSDLELVVEAELQRVGIRFNGLMVAQGGFISQANIQFTTDELSLGSVSLIILGEASDNPATFSNTNDVLSRSPTTTQLTWVPPDWDQTGASGPDQKTPNIGSIVQEIVNRPQWTPGNSIVILFEGSGTRTADSFNGNNGTAAKLFVEYITSDQNPPSVNAGPDQTITNPNVAILDASITDDGLPNPPGTVTSNWSQLSGPGTAGFGDTTLIDTTVSFSVAGNYRLQLSAFDGEKFGNDEISITVDVLPAAPTITSFLPSAAQVASVVAISGVNFTTASNLTINDTSAKFRILNDGEIHVTVPAAASSGPIRITNQYGTTASNNDFTLIPSPNVVVGAGDIADCNGQEEATALLLDSIPGTVIVAGDIAYESGVANEFTTCYNPTWGRHKSRTRPVPGNHEYHAAGAAPYYAYFGPAAADPTKGYYSYDIGQWHIVGVNSQCGEVGGCYAGSPQAQWLQQDLATNPAACTLVYWHRPRYSSSSKHGSDSTYRDLWEILDNAGVELVISGHDHHYERFAPQDADANFAADGVRQFVVGTGGRGLYTVTTVAPNSEAHDDNTFGVLKLTLNSGSYDWEFVPIAGQTFTDSGSDTCFSTNQTPVVNAGLDQVIDFPDTASLEGSAVDDGIPNPPSNLTTTWAQTGGPETALINNVSALNSTVSFPQLGQYEFRLTADDTQYVSTDDVVITVLDPNAEFISIDVRVANGADDVEERLNTGFVYVTSSDLELTYDLDSAVTNQTVGIRFTNVQLAAQSTIIGAHVQFQVDEVSTDAANLVVSGHASDDAAIFVQVNGDVTNRTKTTATVPWTPPAWSSTGVAGADQKTPNISSILQEIVDRPGWSSGNSIVLMIDGTGRRAAESYNGDSSAAPLLHVDYSTAVNEAPEVTITEPPNGSTAEEGTVILFTGTAIDDNDGTLSASLNWTSSLDDDLGSGASISTALSVGTHSVTAAVNDLEGLSGSASITVTITPLPIDVPDVTGQPQATAESTLITAGLTVGAVTSQNSSTVRQFQRAMSSVRTRLPAPPVLQRTRRLIWWSRVVRIIKLL